VRERKGKAFVFGGVNGIRRVAGESEGIPRATARAGLASPIHLLAISTREPPPRQRERLTGAQKAAQGGILRRYLFRGSWYGKEVYYEGKNWGRTKLGIRAAALRPDNKPLIPGG